MELANKKIHFLGDSITFGHGVESERERFTDVIGRETGALCRNYGISGTRIARQRVASDNPTFDLDFVGRVEQMDADADAIVVFGGTNDFGHGDAPIGTMTDRGVDSFCGALHTLYERLIERYPDVLIVVLTPLHRLNEDNPRGDDSRKPTDVGTLYDYVSIIRQVAQRYALPVLDLFASGSMQPKVEAQRLLYMPDGLHPNARGHALLAARIIGFLQQL